MRCYAVARFRGLALGIAVLGSVPFASAKIGSPTPKLSQADDIENAVALWKEAGLPVPSAKAVPARDETYFYGLVEPIDDKTCRIYSGGFVHEEPIEWYAKHKVSWPALSSRARDLHYNDLGDSGREQELGVVAVAVQAAALGHRDVARAIVNGNDLERNHSFPWLGKPQRQGVTAWSAMAIFVNCANRLTEPTSSRADIIKTLQLISSKNLIENSTSQPFSPIGIDDFLEGVVLAHAPSKAKPDTVEWAVDQLVDARVLRGRDIDMTQDPSCKRILSYGLVAVPLLADILSSKKLTRCFSPGFNRSPSQILTVDIVASGVLQAIVDGEMGRYAHMKREAVLEWYQAKKAGTVAEWLMGRLFRPTDFGLYVENDTINAIGTKFPNLLALALDKVREKGVDDDTVLNAIPESALSDAEKRDLLVFAAQGDDPKRISAARPLHRFDRDEYDKLLLRQFAKIPKEFDERHGAPNLALGTDNAAVWSLLEAKVKEADVSMRFILLESLRYAWQDIKPTYRRRAVALLRQYFDDQSKPADWNTNEALRNRFRWAREAPTTGEVALHAASYASGIHYQNVPDKISEAEWMAIRKRIESGEIIERDGQ